jgi:hypothetical protein
MRHFNRRPATDRVSIKCQKTMGTEDVDHPVDRRLCHIERGQFREQYSPASVFWPLLTDAHEAQKDLPGGGPRLLVEVAKDVFGPT